MGRGKKNKNRHKPRVSNNTDSDTKVENKKDLGKLKDDLVEEQKTDSVDNEMGSSPLLKRLIIGEDSDKDIFNLWRYCFEIEYPNDHIRDMRFKIFQDALSPTKTQKEVQFNNYPGFADRTRKELEYAFRYSTDRRELYNFIFQSDIDMWIEELAPVPRLRLRRLPVFYFVENQKDLGKLKDDLVEQKTDSVDNEIGSSPPLKRLIIGEDSDKDIFNLWRYCFEIEYPSDHIRDMRFKTFQDALSPNKTQEEVQFNNYPGFADQTKKELEEYAFRYSTGRRELYNFIFQSDIDMWIEELAPRMTLRRLPDFYFVENEKDLGKLKDDLVEQKTDSVDSEIGSSPPLKRLIIGEDSDKDIFNLWRKYFEIKYPNEDVRDMRFKIFQDALSPTKTQEEVKYDNYPGFADRTRKELEYVFCHCADRKKLCNFIFQSDIDSWINAFEELAQYLLNKRLSGQSLDGTLYGLGRLSS